jgi:archaellum component FlaC
MGAPCQDRRRRGPVGALAAEVREELTRLRREHKRVLMDLEILKKRQNSFREETCEFRVHPS